MYSHGEGAKKKKQATNEENKRNDRQAQSLSAVRKGKKSKLKEGKHSGFEQNSNRGTNNSGSTSSR